MAGSGARSPSVTPTVPPQQKSIFVCTPKARPTKTQAGNTPGSQIPYRTSAPHRARTVPKFKALRRETRLQNEETKGNWDSKPESEPARGVRFVNQKKVLPARRCGAHELRPQKPLSQGLFPPGEASVHAAMSSPALADLRKIPTGDFSSRRRRQVSEPAR